MAQEIPRSFAVTQVKVKLRFITAALITFALVCSAYPVDVLTPEFAIQQTTPPPTASPSTGSEAPLTPGEVLFQNASRDRLDGKNGLALRGYQEYVTQYADGPLAAAAQLWVGMLYFDEADYLNALAALDRVLEKYPSNSRIPGTLLMKGKTLVKLGRYSAGANEFRDLIRRYPGSNAATEARAQLKQSNLSISRSRSHRR